MGNNGQPGWKARIIREKAHEGYSGLNYEDVWDMDTTLAKIISEYLRCFLKAEKGPNGGYPGRYSVYGEDAAKRWLNDIRKMLYGFEEYQRYSSGSTIPQEIWERIHEGMQLFIDCYRDLWI